MALAPGLYPEIVAGTSTGSCKKAFFMSPDLKIRTAVGSHYTGWGSISHEASTFFFPLPINSVLAMARLFVNIRYN